MEPVITNRAILQFRSNTNDIVRLSIPRARLNITEAQARTAMEAMIDGGIIVTASGRPASIKGMEVVTTHRVPIV